MRPWFHFYFYKASLPQIRWCRLLFFLWVGFTAVSLSHGQFKFRESPNRQTPDFLNESAAMELWRLALAQQGLGRFEFLFQLEYRPYRADTVNRLGRMEGEWTPDSRLTEVQILNGLSEEDHRIRLEISQSSRKVSHWSKDSGQSLDVSAVKQFDPLIEGFPLTAFHLAMPFWFWESVRYLGPDRMLGRPIHRFQLKNPTADQQITYVEVAIDEDFGAPLEARFLDVNQERLETFKVRSIGKEGGQWTATHWSFTFHQERSSLHFKLLEARFGD